MRPLASALILASALGSASPAESGLGLIRPDPGVVIGIEWRKIVDSPLGDTFIDQIRKSAPMWSPEVSARLRENLDSVLIAVARGATGKIAAQPPMLMVVKGRFDAAQVRELVKILSPKVEGYRSRELLALPDMAALTGKAPPPEAAGVIARMRIVFLDDTTILIGDGGEVRRAIDRASAGRLPPTAGILAHAADLSSKKDVWMVGNPPPGAMKGSPGAAQMMTGVSDFELGISFQLGLALELSLSAENPKSAGILAQGVQSLIAFLAMSDAGSPRNGILKQVRISSEDSRVRLSLHLDPSQLHKLMEDANATPATEPSPPKTIRIIGLEEGPVEVPLAATK